MRRRLWTVISIPFVVLLFCLVLLVAVGAAPSALDHADATVFYVDDETCPAVGSGTQIAPYCSIQTAVDEAAEGDEIRVATGVYTGAQTVAADPWGGTLYTYTQVVFIDKGLVLLGGYAPPDWETSDPAGNPTVIDARGCGRCITILSTSYERVTVDGFTITGGDYTGLGNPPGGGSTACHGDADTDCGGGIYARASILILRNSVVTANVASRSRYGEGGGIYLWGGAGGRIEDTRVVGNSTTGPSGGGGGMYTYAVGGPLTITHSAFQNNHAPDEGGGLQVYNMQALLTIDNSEFRDNTAATARGGGAQVRLAHGGDLLRMDRVRFEDNQAQEEASAMCIDAAGLGTSRARLTNLLLSGNRVTATTPSDAVIGIDGALANLDVAMAHVTAADNQAPTFLFAEPAGYAGKRLTVTLTNMLVVSFTHAFAAQEVNYGEALIRHTNTLIDNVTNLQHALGGTPTFEAVTALNGDPLLDSTYHLQPGSAAIDAGVDAGVATDIDGQPRPYGAHVDIGADEFTPVAPDSVSISGPTKGSIGRIYAFEAVASPPTATRPFTFTWAPEPREGQGGGIATYLWATQGTYTIAVTAENGMGTTPPTTLEITLEAYHIYLPLILKA